MAGKIVPVAFLAWIFWHFDIPFNWCHTFSGTFCNIYWIRTTCKQTGYLIDKTILGKISGVYVTCVADVGKTQCSVALVWSFKALFSPPSGETVLWGCQHAAFVPALFHFWIRTISCQFYICVGFFFFTLGWIRTQDCFLEESHIPSPLTVTHTPPFSPHDGMIQLQKEETSSKKCF